MKKNKLLSMILSLFLLMQILTPISAAEVKESKNIGKEYYISSLSGDNSRDGTSESLAWETLDKLKGIEFQAGDKILLESDSVFNGFIHLRGVSGTEEDPIIITSYGEGTMPIINGNGEGVWYQDYGTAMDSSKHVKESYVSSTILFYDSNYIEMSNIEITNESDDWDYMYSQKEKNEISMPRTGIAGIVQNTGTMKHIYLDNLNIHNVDGNIDFEHINNGGIQFNASKPENEAETGVAKFDDIKITNNRISKVNKSGISIGYTYQNQQFSGQKISNDAIEKYAHTNLLIEGNYVQEAANDSIAVKYADSPVVRGNVADKSGSLLKEGTTNYATGILPWKTKNALFENNEVFDTVGEGNQDGQAWNVNHSDGTVFQYNYSHNNGGGAVLFSTNESSDGSFRYNISQNDLGQFMTVQGSPTASIHNNVFYVDGDRGTRVHNQDGKSNGSAIVANNIFYNLSSQNPNDKWEHNNKQIFTNNLYFNYESTPEGDLNAVTEDPLFINIGSGPTTPKVNVHDRTVFDGFKVKENSPVVNKGIYMPNNTTKDFFGNPIGLIPDIGIQEIDASEDVDGIYADEFIQTDSEISEIPKGTTVKQFKDSIINPKNAILSVQDTANVVLTDEELIASGYKLVAKFDSGTVKEYNLSMLIILEYVEYPLDGITAKAGSEQSGEGASKALDNNLDTIWHTAWSGASRDKIWITLDMGKAKPISMLKYVPRKTQVNGIFTKYAIYTKENESDEWTEISTSNNLWKLDNETKYAYFNEVHARYIKLQAIESGSDGSNNFGSAAEIRVGFEQEAN